MTEASLLGWTKRYKRESAFRSFQKISFHKIDVNSGELPDRRQRHHLGNWCYWVENVIIT
jgi:hypothetical protein